MSMPLSPVSEPVSPNVTVCAPAGASFSNDPVDRLNPLFRENIDWRAKASIGHVLNTGRHRHMSSPYALNYNRDNQFGQEACNQRAPLQLESAGSAGGSSTIALMLQNDGGKNNGHGAHPLHLSSSSVGGLEAVVQEGSLDSPRSGVGWQQAQLSLRNEATAKSYPSTPLYNQGSSFQYPPHKQQHQDVISATVSGQDVMVSGVQLAHLHNGWQEKSASVLVRECDSSTSASGSGRGSSSAAQRDLQDLLSPAPIEDDLQTTLEDLRDFDNDFSRFAQELEAMEGTAVGELNELV